MQIFRHLSEVPIELRPHRRHHRQLRWRPSRSPFGHRRGCRPRPCSQSKIHRHHLRTPSRPGPAPRIHPSPHHPAHRKTRSALLDRPRRRPRPAIHQRILADVRPGVRHRSPPPRPPRHRTPRRRKLPLRPPRRGRRQQSGSPWPRTRLHLQGLFPQTIRNQPISSSRIRQLIAEGNVSQVRSLLGHPFAIASTPASGRGYGTRYTVPTINLAPYAELLPANGVYITTLTVGSAPTSETFDAVSNVGNRPTFGADSFTVESHLLNFHPITLDEQTPLTLTFLRRLRPEIRWPNPEALREQIGRDVATAKRYFTLCRAVASQRHSARPHQPSLAP